MDESTLRQLQGWNALLVDAVHAAVNETQRAHAEIARYPYAVLTKVTPIAGPVRVVEATQTGITNAVYGSIRILTGVAGAVTTFTLDEIARRLPADGRPPGGMAPKAPSGGP